MFTGQWQSQAGVYSRLIKGTVQNWTALQAVTQMEIDEVYMVLDPEGTFLLNRKRSGLYRWDGANWVKLSYAIDLFKDNNLTMYDDNDNTKKAQFQLENISAGNTRIITLPDKNIQIDDIGDDRAPSNHASDHTDGTDDIQDATNSKKGLATAAQITNVEANTAHRGSDGKNHSDVVLNNAHRGLIANNPHGTIASQINIDKLGTPTYQTIQDYLNTIQSGAIITKTDDLSMVDNGSGALNVGAGKGLIKTTNSEVGNTIFFEWDAMIDIALSGDALNWVYVDYNGGTPIVAVTVTLTNINHKTQIVIGRVYKEGSDLHILKVGAFFADYMMRHCNRDFEIHYFSYASGALVTEKATRNVGVSAGIFYCALNRIPTNTFDSSGSDTFRVFYRASPSGWTILTSQTQISNTQYDDGDGTPGTVTPNQYGIWWVYMHHDSHVDIVMGQDSYTLAEAEDALAPAVIPAVLVNMAILIAKIIVKRGGTNFTLIQPQVDGNIISLAPVIPIFGTEYNYAEQNGQGTRAAVGIETRVTLAMTDLPAGNYKISWSFEIGTVNTANVQQWLVDIDDTTVLCSGSDKIIDVAYNNPIAGFRSNVALSGSSTIKIKFGKVSGANSVTIDRAKIEVFRVS